MKKYKVNWRYYFFLILFSSVTLIGIRVIYMLLNGEVSDHGEEMSKSLAIIMSVMIGAVLSTYAITSCTLLKQLLKFKKCALSITSNGIENTLVFINLFAFVLVSPVKLIPWEAVTYFDDSIDSPHIRVNIRMVEAGWFSKMLLFIFGYRFCAPFVKPVVKREDLILYEYRFNLRKF